MPKVVLPLPPSQLRVNQRMAHDWRTIRGIEERYRADCELLAGAQAAEWEGVTVTWPVHLYLTVYLGKRQRADTWDVGAWAKVAGDVLVKAGALPDDNASRINPFTARVDRDPSNPRLVFEWE